MIVPDNDLWTVEECEEQIAEAQYVLDHPNEYDPSIREVARRSLGHYKRYLAYAKRIEERVRELEQALRHIAAIDCCATWYNDPSTGFSDAARRLREARAIARAALQLKEKAGS